MSMVLRVFGIVLYIEHPKIAINNNSGTVNDFF